LLPAAIALVPADLASVAELLRLLRTLLRTLGAQLGAPLLHFALDHTVRAVSVVVATAIAHDSKPSGAVERVLCVCLQVLLAVSDPPVHNVAVRASLLPAIVEAIGTTQIGSLLADGPRGLSPLRREQLFAVVASLLRVHWRSLCEHNGQLAALTHLLSCGLSRPVEHAAFRTCVGACREIAARRVDKDHPGAVWRQQQLNELVSLLVAVRLEPSHAAVHDEVTECLTTFLASASPQELGVPHPSIQLVQRHLGAQQGLAPSQKQMLYDEFAAADSRDAPSFARNIARLANDLAYFNNEALYSSSSVW